MMERKYWALFTIAAAMGKPLAPVQLQKSLFLLGEAFGPALGDFYLFRPYNYGPFDSSVYLDAEELANEGLVSIQPSPRGRWNEYAATPAGMEKAKELRDEAGPGFVDYLNRVVEWALQLTFQQLLRAIHKQYPEYRAQSVFQG